MGKGPEKRRDGTKGTKKNRLKARGHQGEHRSGEEIKNKEKRYVVCKKWHDT